jgi:hypothetical protein
MHLCATEISESLYSSTLFVSYHPPPPLLSFFAYTASSDSNQAQCCQMSAMAGIWPSAMANFAKEAAKWRHIWRSNMSTDMTGFWLPTMVHHQQH